MRGLTVAMLLAILTCAAQTASAQPAPQSAIPAFSITTPATIVVPAETTVELALASRPVLSRTAKAGKSVHAETAFPEAVGRRIRAGGPGTWRRRLQLRALRRR
jgi:hypothetical protein